MIYLFCYLLIFLLANVDSGLISQFIHSLSFFASLNFFIPVCFLFLTSPFSFLHPSLIIWFPLFKISNYCFLSKHLRSICTFFTCLPLCLQPYLSVTSSIFYFPFFPFRTSFSFFHSAGFLSIYIFLHSYMTLALLCYYHFLLLLLFIYLLLFPYFRIIFLISFLLHNTLNFFQVSLLKYSLSLLFLIQLPRFCLLSLFVLQRLFVLVLLIHLLLFLHCSRLYILAVSSFPLFL